jgi:hypothetical protein
MKTIDNYSILLIAVGGMGEKVSETLASEKTNVRFELMQILVN